MTVEFLLEAAFQRLASFMAHLAYLNETSREQDVEHPARVISTRCSECGAGIFSLTCIEAADGMRRKCRRCFSEMQYE